MGDTGSLVLGVSMAIITFHFNEFQPILKPGIESLPAISLAIVIVPIVDTIRVMTIRIAQKRSPFSPDMNHIHHSILKLTDNHLATSTIIIAVNGLIILFTFLLIEEIGNNLLFFILLIMGFTLANVPSLIVKWKLKDTIDPEERERKSIFAFTLFAKDKK